MADSDCSDAGESTNNTDCDDADADINPQAEEILDDGVDQNCDGEDGASQTEPSSEEPSEPGSEEPGEPSEPGGEEPSSNEPATENNVPAENERKESGCSTSGSFNDSGLFAFLIGWLVLGRQRRRS